MPVGENAESRARDAINAQDPKSGQEMQQVQALQSSIQEIQGERTNNLQAARMGAEGDARENAAMLQAAEMATLGGAAGGAGVAIENATPIGQTSPQTQALLSKYGVGKPKSQRVSTRNVQVTPQKITINNNTTNNTTNNVAIPAANIGGPVQGRTLAIKQQPDQSQARFKTWISNAFARQNQAAQQREKEYQRREWSLSRTTGKLMKKLQELGSTISERMDPRKMASSVGGHLKTLLFLFGTTFLAKNWRKIIHIGSSIERFFWGDASATDKNSKEPGWKKFVKSIFGAEQEESVGEAIKRFFWNDPKSGGKGGAGVLNYLWEKIKNWFEEGSFAASKIEFPKIDIVKKPLEAVQGLFKYLSAVLTSLFTGGEGLKTALKGQINERADSTLRNRDNDFDKWGDNEDRYHEAMSERSLRRYGVTDEEVLKLGVNVGDAVEGWGNGRYAAHLFSNDITKEGNLTGTTGSVHRQVASLEGMVKDDEKMNIAAFSQGVKNLDTYMKADSAKGDKAQGLVLPSGESLKNLGVSQSTIDSLRKSGNLKKKKFVQVIDEKTPEEKREELKYATNDEKEAAKTYVNNLLANKIGARKTIWKVIGGAAGLAGGLILAPATGGASLLISAASLASAGITGAWLGSKLAGGAHDIIMDEKLQAALKWASTKDEVKLVRPYIIRLVPEDQVNGRHIIKDASTEFEKEVLDAEGWERVKQELGLSGASYDLFDENYRDTITSTYKRAAVASGMNINSLPEKSDISDVDFEAAQELDGVRAKNDAEEQEMRDSSRFVKAGENIKAGVSSAVEGVKGYFYSGDDKQGASKSQQAAFIQKMRDAYSKKFKELGLDEKYIDALVAQDAYESTWGTSDLTKQNNYGGIRNGNKGWQSFDSLDDYIDYKVNLLNSDKYKAFSGDVNSMINRVSKIYAPASDGNKDYSGNWTTMFNQVQGFKPLSTDEIKALRNQGRWAEADMASASWERIEDVLTKGGVTGFKVTSKKREPGKAGNSGNKSYHTTDNLAIDIVPIEGQTFEGLKQQMLASPLIQKYFADRKLGVLDETSKEMLEKTGGTGPHFHIGPDNSSVQGWLAWNKEEKVTPDNYVEEKALDDTYLAGFDWQKSGGDNSALNMAQADIPKVTVTSGRPITSGTTGGSSSGVSYTERAAKDVSGTTNSNANLELLITSTNSKLDKLTNLLAQASDQQVQATLTVAQGLGNMSVTVNNQPAPLKPVDQFTSSLYQKG